MIIDVHSHLIPSELLSEKEFDIKIEKRNDTGYNVKVFGLTVGPIQNNMFEPDIQIEEMRKDGIRKKVLSIPPFLFAYNKDLEWAEKWSKSFNDSLIEICDDNPDSFIAFATIPLQNPKSAVNEMKRCLEEKGFRGIEIGTNINGLDLNNEKFSLFFEEADRIGCNILVHPNNIVSTERLSKYYMKNLVGNPFETTISSANLILSGFFKKYPNLKFCFSHGGGALPYILGRIKHGIKARPEIVGIEESLILNDNIFFDCVVFDKKILKFLIDYCGIERILLGTDYPFDMQLKQPVKFVEETLDIKEQKMILEENPEKFLK